MGSRRFRGAFVIAGMALAALAPTVAHAEVGTPISLGPGASPNVTVESDGTAHIAWRGEGANSKLLTYCRLPAGASACSPQTGISAPGDSLTLPLAFGNGNVVRVISYRYGLTGASFDNTIVFTSNDSGASFDAGTVIGRLAPNDFAFGPGDTVSGITSASSCGTCFQSWPLSGGTPGTAVLSSDHPYNGAITMVDANTPLAVFAAGNGDTQFRRYGGTGDVNDANNWTPPVDIGPADYPRLVSGPSGVFLVSQDALSGSVMQARRYDGTTFGNRVQITTGTRADHLAEDGAGRLHVVGGKYSSGPTGAALFYGTSDNGARWDTDDAQFPGLPADMRIAIAPDHFGVVVGRYALGQTGLFATRVGPSAAKPTVARFVDASLVSGTVLIRVPGSKKFVRLAKGDVIPVGSVVDAKGGRVRITIAVPGGTQQSTDFFKGVFKVAQAKNGLATMALQGGNFRSCGRSAGRAASIAAKKKVIRHLWGEGSGKFRTKGRYATASIRGTTWDTIDRCDGTLVRVTKGRIVVNDLRRKKTVSLRAGQSYLAKAR